MYVLSIDGISRIFSGHETYILRTKIESQPMRCVIYYNYNYFTYVYMSTLYICLWNLPLCERLYFIFGFNKSIQYVVLLLKTSIISIIWITGSKILTRLGDTIWINWLHFYVPHMNPRLPILLRMNMGLKELFIF